MSSESASSIVEASLDAVFENTLESTSEDLPVEKWSSLILEQTIPYDNPKKALYAEGLYVPGSGEICAKYISLSHSSVMRHVYYRYPSVKDPGIQEALFEPEPKKIYSYDGQELYLDLCLEMNVIPVRPFHSGLLNEEINLKYYCVNPFGVRAMCLSLVNNQYVKRLDLTSNHLSHDACYHLGQLLGESFALQELVLSGCKLGPEGLRLLVNRLSKRSLELLDVSKNGIGDTGFQYLADEIMKGGVIKRLNISFNKLGKTAGLAFAEALNYNNAITHLDISWNEMYTPKGCNDLLQVLGESEVLLELNLSWNSLTTGLPLKQLVNLKTLQVLDLSNNRLSTPAVQAITSSLHLAKKLQTLDLSHNPLSPEDAFTVLKKMRSGKVKLINLYMEGVTVTKEFVAVLQEILLLKHRIGTTITHGDVLHDFTPSFRDMKEIVMKRLDYITRVARKSNVDIGVFFLQTHKKHGRVMELRDLVLELKLVSAPVDDDLLDELVNCFPAPKSNKGGRTVNLHAIAEYVRRAWPEKKLPPSPPPQRKQIIVVKKKETKAKNKK